MILSHALWKRRFNGDSGIVGRPVRLSGRMFRVIGVLPDGFQHVGGTYRTYGHGEAVDVWSVLTVPRDDGPQHRYSHYFNVVGRVRAGVSRSAMDEDLHRTAQIVATRYPSPNSPWTSRAVPLKEEIVGTSESTLVALSGAVTVVLVLACVNVAGLLLGRAAARSREIGVRAALGATRMRLTTQLLIESVVLAGAGGAIGVGFAYGAVAALGRFGPADTPRLAAIAVDGPVLLYALSATVFSALLFGLAPALQLVTHRIGRDAEAGGRRVAGSRHQRTRRALAAVEVALAFVLVVSSGLLLRSFMAMVDANPGFRPEGAITASVELPIARYDEDSCDGVLHSCGRARSIAPGRARRDLHVGSAVDRLRREHGLLRSSAGSSPSATDRRRATTSSRRGTRHATGTPLVAGRDLSPSDVKDAPLALLVNESAARKYWKTRRRGRRGAGGSVGTTSGRWSASSATSATCPGTSARCPRCIFRSRRRGTRSACSWSRGPTSIRASLVEPMRRALSEIDPELPLANVKALEAVAGAAVATRRLTLWLVATFGVTALFLAVVGIYGVMTQVVGERMQEFGVRQALGATRGDILRLVMSSGADPDCGRADRGSSCCRSPRHGCSRRCCTASAPRTPPRSPRSRCCCSPSRSSPLTCRPAGPRGSAPRQHCEGSRAVLGSAFLVLRSGSAPAFFVVPFFVARSRFNVPQRNE